MIGDKKLQFNLWLWVGLFILTRILFLLFASPDFFYDVDGSRGVMAYELINSRLTRPIFEYQLEHYLGGSLVVSLLAVPFFLLFGSSAFALKFVALSFFLFTLIVWILVCLRFFNRNVAIFFSILFIFSPPFFTEMSLFTIGFYTESILFTAVTILIFYEIFFKQKMKVAYFIILGFVSGLGLWFVYTFGITLMICLFCWFLFDKKFLLRKNFWIFGGGFLLGFSPWIYYNLQHNFQGLYVNGVHLSNFFMIKNFLKILNIQESILRNIAGSLHLSKVWIFDRILVSIAYYLIFIIAFFSMFWNNRKNLFLSKEFFFIFYCFAICVAFQLAVKKDVAYLIPLHPFIFITIALFLNRLFASKMRFKMVASIVLIFLLTLITLISNIKILSIKSAGYGLKAKGFSYYYLGEMDALRAKNDIPSIYRYISLSKNIEVTYLDDYFRGFSSGIKDELDFSSAGGIGELINFVKLVDQKYRKYFYRPIGVQFALSLKDDIEKSKYWLSQIDTEYQHYVYEAWVERIAGSDFTYEVGKKMVAQIGEVFYPVYYRALGNFKGLKYSDVYKKIDEKYIPYFFEGIGKSLVAEWYLHKINIDINRLIESMDEKYRIFVCQGIGKEMASLVKNEPANKFIWERFIDAMSVSYRKYCLAGFKARY